MSFKASKNRGFPGKILRFLCFLATSNWSASIITVGHAAEQGLAATGLPHDPYWILGDQAIRAQHGQAVDDGLASQQTIERVGMKVRKPGHMQGGFFV